MSDSVLNKLQDYFTQFKPIKYLKGETIIRAGDQPAGIYFVKSGFVRMYILFADGRELTLNIFKPGSFFPMMWAIGGIDNNYFFQAVDEVTVYRADQKSTIDNFKADPDILYDLVQRLLVGMDGLLTNVQFLLSGNSYSRIASVILITAKRFGLTSIKKETLISFPLTHQNIAKMAGVARETASIVMKQLTDQGIISKKGQNYVVLDMEKLSEQVSVESIGGESAIAV